MLVAGASGKEPWVRVFCEQHEDLLCERSDGTFDAYQVKTRGSEGGHWELQRYAAKVIRHERLPEGSCSLF